jgi:hypothetical protein
MKGYKCQGPFHLYCGVHFADNAVLVLMCISVAQMFSRYIATYLAALVEYAPRLAFTTVPNTLCMYIAAEILELSGNAAKERSPGQISLVGGLTIVTDDIKVLPEL